MSESSLRAPQLERRTTSSPLPRQRAHPAAYVLAGGLIAGTLDMLYACAFWAVKAHLPAQRIFQDVAAGLLGPAAFQGGWPSAALGLVLHFLIALATAVVYYRVALRWPLLWRQPLLAGAIYGLLVYGAMNYIVLPLSAAGPGSKDALWIGLSILAHMFLIGMPCAVLARRAVLAGQFAS